MSVQNNAELTLISGFNPELLFLTDMFDINYFNHVMIFGEK